MVKETQMFLKDGVGNMEIGKQKLLLKRFRCPIHLGRKLIHWQIFDATTLLNSMDGQNFAKTLI